MENKTNLRLPVSHFEEKREHSNVLRAPGGQYPLEEKNKILIKELNSLGKKKPSGEQAEKYWRNTTLANTAFWQTEDEKENYNDIIPDDLSEIDQGQEVDGEMVKIKRINPVVKSEGRIIGDAFLNAFRSATKTGAIGKIPLWCSGFWVRVGGFGSEETFRLAGRLRNVRDNIGIKTNGLLYSTDDVHIISEITDYILDHVIDSNLEGWEVRSTLEAALRITDTPHLHAGALDTSYNQGYPLHQECQNVLDEDKNCDYATLPKEEREKNIARLDFIATAMRTTARFPSTAARFLTREKVTLEEVIEYQETLDDHNNASRTIGTYQLPGAQPIRFIGGVPSYARYKQEGRRWIADVVSVAGDLVNTETSQSLSTEERQRLIAARSRQVMAQHQHSWINKVRIGDGENESRSDILEALGILSENRELAKQVYDDIRAFSKKQMHVYTAIPNWVCPKCRKAQPDVDEKINLIPFSLTAYFFITLVDRAAQSSS